MNVLTLCKRFMNVGMEFGTMSCVYTKVNYFWRTEVCLHTRHYSVKTLSESFIDVRWMLKQYFPVSTGRETSLKDP